MSILSNPAIARRLALFQSPGTSIGTSPVDVLFKEAATKACQEAEKTNPDIGMLIKMIDNMLAARDCFCYSNSLGYMAKNNISS